MARVTGGGIRQSHLHLHHEVNILNLMTRLWEFSGRHIQWLKIFNFVVIWLCVFSTKPHSFSRVCMVVSMAASLAIILIDLHERWLKSKVVVVNDESSTAKKHI